MWTIVLATLGILAMLESLFVLCCPGTMISIKKMLIKNAKKFKTAAVIEFIIGLILLLIALTSKI